LPWSVALPSTSWLFIILVIALILLLVGYV